MASWAEFEIAAPRLAGIAGERFATLEVLLVGTIRKDGGPRVTPIEYQVVDGNLYFGGMWQSKKCLDMERDPRCVLHSPVTMKAGTEGDVKVSGFALTVTDPAERQHTAQVGFERSGSPRPKEPYHLFRLDISEVGFVVFGDGVAAFRTRLEGSAGANVRLLGEGPNTSGYLVATWKSSTPL